MVRWQSNGLLTVRPQLKTLSMCYIIVLLLGINNHYCHLWLKDVGPLVGKHSSIHMLLQWRKTNTGKLLFSKIWECINHCQNNSINWGKKKYSNFMSDSQCIYNFITLDSISTDTTIIEYCKIAYASNMWVEPNSWPHTNTLFYLSGWIQTFDRLLTYSFTKPYMQANKVAMYAKNGSTLSYDDLTNLKVGFGDGWAYDEFCLARYTDIAV